MAIRKAVFPVAGLGTRFLPATKASPKEMLPVVDKPLIQYAVEEAISAGVTELIFVTGRHKRSIEDHFDYADELERELASKHKHALLAMLRGILPQGVSCLYIRQPQALGLGHAVLCAQPAVGDAPFAVILADDLIAAEVPVMRQMVTHYAQQKHSLLGVEDVAPEDTASYGIIQATVCGDNLLQLQSIVEKPQPSVAPSTLAVVGRYIFNPSIFAHLRQIQPGQGGEIQLTDAIATLLTQEPVLAYRFSGKRFDCGSKLGFLKANVEFALQHPELSTDFRKYLDATC